MIVDLLDLQRAEFYHAIFFNFHWEFILTPPAVIIW